MSGLCLLRLQEERKSWRKDHPYGFFAKPGKLQDGSLDLRTWHAGIPGKPNTAWEGGVYKLRLEFPEEYPAKPPKCKSFYPSSWPTGARGCARDRSIGADQLTDTSVQASSTRRSSTQTSTRAARSVCRL